MGIGEAQVNYKLRDPNFSRQRYWGEPFPIVFRDGMPYTLDESELPLELPEVESYKPTGDGESPLANSAIAALKAKAAKMAKVADEVTSPVKLKRAELPGASNNNNDDDNASRQPDDSVSTVLSAGGTTTVTTASSAGGAGRTLHADRRIGAGIGSGFRPNCRSECGKLRQ